jgi:hypothetical protein
MRVLHISTADTGSAAQAMMHWHACLKEAGVESRVLCFQKSLDDPDIFEPALLPDRTEAIKSQATQERWIDRCRTSFSDSLFSQAFYAQPLIGEELTDWAEILHIHSVSRSFDISHFSALAAKGKALVLTPHDSWTITGGCHSTSGCEKFREGCQACPMVKGESQRLVEISHKLKQKVFSSSLHALICPSDQIRNEIVERPGFQTIDSYLVPYCRETERCGPEQTILDNQKIIQQLRSAYEVAASKASVKAIRSGVSDERVEYQVFALRAIVDLLENARKQVTELTVEVQWLREQSLALAGLRDILERSLQEIDESALKGPAELEYEVRWLRKQSLEFGSVRELLRICMAEFDEMFSLLPAPDRIRHALSAEKIPKEAERSLDEQWTETSAKIYLLKWHLGWRPKKL